MKIIATISFCCLLTFHLAAQVYINELDYDQPSTDATEFIELVGPDGTSLDGYVIILVNGNDGSEYLSADLTGQVIPSDNVNGYGFFVIGAATVPNVDYTPSGWPTTNIIQNGAPDGILLKLSSVVVDGFSYEGVITNHVDFTPGMAITPVDAGSDNSIGRISFGFDANNQNQFFAQTVETPSPGEINAAHGQVIGGDPPPNIFNITRTPHIPDGNQNTTVSADVTDDSFVNSVELRYAINDGTMQSVVMTNTGGDTWSADIPESDYMDADRVRFWIWAQDDAPQTSQTDTMNFFVGDTPIGDLHAADSDGVLLYSGYDARVTGVATVDNPTFSTSFLDVYMQDTSAGINVFSFSIDTSFSFIAGNNYTIVGTVEQFNGKTEIIPGDETDIVDNGPGTVPPPVVKTIAELLLDAEIYEGMLVSILQVDTTGGGDPWPSQGSSADIDITDDGGTSVLTLRIDQDTNIDGTVEPTWPVTIAGIFNQFDNSFPYTEGYQIMPRSTDDIDITVGIEPISVGSLPKQFSLHQNYPNPFNPSTTLRFDIPSGLNPASKAELNVYNSLGQRVTKLANSRFPAGTYEIEWNGTADNGQEVPSGVYFGVLYMDGLQKTVKMILLK